MIVLGLLLILFAAGAGVALFVVTSPVTTGVTLDVWGTQVKVLPVALLIAGAAVLLIFWLGWTLVRASVKRRARRRREAKEAQAQADRQAQAERQAEANRQVAADQQAQAERQAEANRQVAADQQAQADRQARLGGPGENRG